jgi:hypothetical protein
VVGISSDQHLEEKNNKIKKTRDPKKKFFIKTH